MVQTKRLSTAKVRSSKNFGNFSLCKFVVVDSPHILHFFPIIITMLFMFCSVTKPKWHYNFQLRDLETVSGSQVSLSLVHSMFPFFSFYLIIALLMSCTVKTNDLFLMVQLAHLTHQPTWSQKGILL